MSTTADIEMKALALIFLLTTRIGCRSCLLQSGFGYQWPQFSDRVVQTDILTLANNVGSGIQCVLLCLGLQSCVSVFYRQVYRTCQFHDVLFLSPGDGEDESGTDYYSVTVGSCPQNYIHARALGLCYRQHLYKRDYDVSVADCASRGEHFIVIDSQEKQDHVKKQILSSSEAVLNSYFIDGSDAATEGDWKFHDGRRMIFFAWIEGYPNKRDYLVMSMKNNFSWENRNRDSDGSATSRFSNSLITVSVLASSDNAESGLQCVKKCMERLACVSVFYREVSRRCQLHDVLFLSPQDGVVEIGTKYYSLTTGSCPSGYVHVRNLRWCYQLHMNRIHYDKGVEDCASRGEHLVVIDSQDKQDHLTKQITSSSDARTRGIFIDGTYVEKEKKWMFHDGRPMTFFPWRQGYPKPISQGRDHLLASKLDLAFSWRNINKNTVGVRKVSRRCQFHDVMFLSPTDGKEEVGTEYFRLTLSSCPSSYIYVQHLSMCYQIFFNWVFYEEAVGYCASRDEHLIVIDSQEKQDHVQKQLTSSSDIPSKGFFIDGSDVKEEGQWLFHDGRPMTFFAWQDGYPKTQSFRDYLVASKTEGLFQWRNVNVFSFLLKYYMCEKDI